uniref:Uncharacterized protein n=1 Tax=Arundo donax TaxID=35708 RepID=A0A0A9D207_ARUDO
MLMKESMLSQQNFQVKYNMVVQLRTFHHLKLSTKVRKVLVTMLQLSCRAGLQQHHSLMVKLCLKILARWCLSLVPKLGNG